MKNPQIHLKFLGNDTYSAYAEEGANAIFIEEIVAKDKEEALKEVKKLIKDSHKTLRSNRCSN